MCTSIIVNKKKTIVGWNLDLANMEHRIRTADEGVYIEINDEKEGWMPLFGANSRGDFVGMPTCWPYDEKSEPRDGCENVIMLDIDLLLQKKTFAEIRDIAENQPICSIPEVTFMAALSDKDGNVLHIIPGQGYKYYTKPEFAVLTNFSPLKGEKPRHPWMGMDRYRRATSLLTSAGDDFDVADCFDVLKEVSQTVCPTVVSMVFDVAARTVYWCENRDWENVNKKELLRCGKAGN